MTKYFSITCQHEQVILERSPDSPKNVYAAKEQILKQHDCHYTLTLYISVTAHYI